MAAARIAGAAVLIAVLTVASRVAGFGRILVFAWAVGAKDLGDIYQTANTVPNIIFEIVAGGALASLVVPAIAGPLVRGDKSHVSAAASALLTWVVTLLIPVAVLVMVAAEPIVRLMAQQASGPTVSVGVDLLRIFAPQLPLYGIGIVLTGVLQAHRRFAWPVLAPLMSSVTVSATYLIFAATVGRGADVAGVGRVGVLILGLGTTAGVVVLSLCLIIPVRRLGLRLRPTYRLGEAAALVRRLAVAGALTVGAQQASLALVIVLANGGPTGTVVIYTLAQAVYLLPWAVLALPVATSAYPSLAHAHASGDPGGFTVTVAAAVRATLLLGALGAAGLIAIAPDAATVLAATAAGSPDPRLIAAGIVGFGPGLIGYGLFALLSRTLYARGAAGAATVATVVGWASVAVAALVLASGWQSDDRVAALAWANTAGMAVLGGTLLVMVGRLAGRAALSGAVRAGATGVLAGVVASAGAHGVRWITLPHTLGVGSALARGMLSGVVLVVIFLAVAYAADRGTLRPVLTALVGRVRSSRSAGEPVPRREEAVP
jgi:putative peptidoglycan lipid II flippase